MGEQTGDFPERDNADERIRPVFGCGIRVVVSDIHREQRNPGTDYRNEAYGDFGGGSKRNQIPVVGPVVGIYEAYGTLSDPKSSTSDRVFAIVAILPTGDIFRILAHTKIVQARVRVAEQAAGKAARGLTHWGNPKTLADHFARHGKEFGAKSADDYAKQASDFFRRSQTDRLPTKIDADGVTRVYDPQSNTFGAFNPDGTTRTFFKLMSPTYFDRQPSGAPWGP